MEAKPTQRQQPAFSMCRRLKVLTAFKARCASFWADPVEWLLPTSRPLDERAERVWNEQQK